jgi:hypothetical protein
VRTVGGQEVKLADEIVTVAHSERMQEREREEEAVSVEVQDEGNN